MAHEKIITLEPANSIGAGVMKSTHRCVLSSYDSSMWNAAGTGNEYTRTVGAAR
ncbi:hypothetical protein [Novipirellula herctigrandis]|uniref:hypothetical protein n=1 Tax=Novipirellula herctigrandis TaxID=2527986 RepID=UPI003AF34F5D